MKGKNILFVLLLSYVLLWFVVLFGLWGIYPLGAYWKIEELKFIQLKKETHFLNEINNFNTKISEMNKEVILLQTQINILQENQSLILEWESNYHNFK